jgi:Spy/CpxP family protein refolding chaperone
MLLTLSKKKYHKTKKEMKKFLLMCCILLGISAVSRAQGGGGRMSPEDRAKQMQTSLKLSDDQTAKITAILKVQATKMDSVRTAANGDRDAMRSAMGPIRTNTNTQIKAVLTPDQAAAYQKMQDEMRARMQQGGGGGGGGN